MKAELLQTFGHFYDAIAAVDNAEIAASVTVDYFGALKQVVTRMTENTIPQNEGYPQVMATAPVAGIVHYLNDKVGKKMYRYQIYPAVTDKGDRRETKRSDVSIIRILDSRTFVIIQCKLNVGLTFTATNVDPLAQLFLEAVYSSQKEGSHYEEILCILTNWTVWHCFKMNVAHTPLMVKNYVKVVAATPCAAAL